jgi:ribosomal protein RSM22 (predicted rRNA methylase)
MVSQDFLNIIGSGNLRILDIGSGPAVTSLAITDLFVCILKHLKKLNNWPIIKVINVTYVLNDTSSICLGTGQRMLKDYFQMSRRHKTIVVNGQMITVPKAFPVNINQIWRIARNLGAYDIVTLSYIVVPLNDDGGLSNIVNGLMNIEQSCYYNGRILIVQDRYNESLMRRIGAALDIPTHKEELTQQIYPKRDVNETYTYSYYSCLYAPGKKVADRLSTVA